MGGGEGQVKFYPYEKGVGKSSAMLQGGGGTKCFGVVLTQELEVLAILKGGERAKSFCPLKGGPKIFYPVLRGW